ncbi:hypothetical protein K7H91_12230 [Martelella mediterranea]|uniref:hypothetical protein n=1 Tax=Martelella mediterranea TaxID=293089 RepID=UPI001E4DC89D|nr:hypothetical protein [Martelella mediterranea]MCD1634540.1 hypothetical protein [Martelella mediterranea]
MKSTDTIHVSPRRIDQLKAIAAARNTSVSDAIGHMIRKEIAEGTIPANIPGIVIKRTDAGVSVQLDDGPVKVMSVKSAVNLVEAIRDSVALGRKIVGPTCGYSIEPRGRGFKLFVPDPGEGISLSGDLALDIADQIEQAVA